MGREVSANDTVMVVWNTVLLDQFVRFDHLLITGRAEHSSAWFITTRAANTH